MNVLHNGKESLSILESYIHVVMNQTDAYKTQYKIHIDET